MSAVAWRYALLLLMVAVLGVAGYAGYHLYPRFDLPPADGATLLLLAVAAGVASFFSPCAFGLLAALVGRRSGRGKAATDVRPLRFAFGMSLGASVFVLALGGVIALGGAGLAADITFTSATGRGLRLAVGVFLLAAGLVQLELLPSPLARARAWSLPLARLSARERRERPLWGQVLFGFGYLVAGLG